MAFISGNIILSCSPNFLFIVYEIWYIKSVKEIVLYSFYTCWEFSVLYNGNNIFPSRISNDLLLWEPTAPSPVETFENLSYGVGLSVASQLINTFSKDSFSQFKSAVNYGNALNRSSSAFVSQ